MADLEIISTGTFLPPKYSVRELGQKNGLDMSSYEGWDHIRVANEEDHPSTMAATSLKKAIDAAGIRPEDLKLIIGQHATHDHAPPWSLSLEVLGLLKIPKTCLALDINGTCAGAALGLEFASRWLAGQTGGYAAIVCGERSSSHIDWKNPKSMSTFSFSDGGGAMVVGMGVAPGPLKVSLGGFCFRSTPALNTLVWRPGGGTRNLRPDDKYKTIPVGTPAEIAHIFAQNVREAVGELRTKFHLKDFDCIIPTQSTKSFVKMLHLTLNVPEEKIINIGHDIGHIMAVDIIAGIEEAHNLGRLNGNTLLAGLGEALAFGAWIKNTKES